MDAPSPAIVGIDTRTTYYTGEDGRRRAVLFEEDYRELIETISVLQNEPGSRKSRPCSEPKQDLTEMEKRIMSAITDWAATEQADLTAIATTLNTIAAGVVALNNQITALQNSPGTLSASDQAALDAIKTASDALAAQASAIVVPPTTPPPTTTAAKT